MGGPQAGASKVDETMFADEASAALPLERCMRVLPHHGDTGGFFIAVLRKVAPVGDLPFRITNSRRGPMSQLSRAPHSPRLSPGLGEPLNPSEVDC